MHYCQANCHSLSNAAAVLRVCLLVAQRAAFALLSCMHLGSFFGPTSHPTSSCCPPLESLVQKDDSDLCVTCQLQGGHKIYHSSNYTPNKKRMVQVRHTRLRAKEVARLWVGHQAFVDSLEAGMMSGPSTPRVSEVKDEGKYYLVVWL